jgi:hypothetical protein
MHNYSTYSIKGCSAGFFQLKFTESLMDAVIAQEIEKHSFILMFTVGSISYLKVSSY